MAEVKLAILGLGPAGEALVPFIDTTSALLAESLAREVLGWLDPLPAQDPGS